MRIPQWGLYMKQLHRLQHVGACYLNPEYQYSPTFLASADIKIGLYNCLQRMVSDAEERLKIYLQMDAFKMQEIFLVCLRLS